MRTSAVSYKSMLLRILCMGALTMGIAACDKPAVHFIGRWTNDADGPRANWAGSGVAANFVGVEASITFNIKSTRDLYFIAIVDGGKPSRFVGVNGRATYPLATGLARTDHEVQVTLETEGEFGSIQFLGFEFARGQLLNSPAPKLRMEVIGDSLSCGYGNIGTSTVENEANGWGAEVCPFSTATSSVYMAYGSVLARMFGAEVSTVCWSGRGLYEDGSGNLDSPATPQLPSLYLDALAGNSSNGFALHQYPYPEAGENASSSDIVLVNLGTNDMAGAGGMPPVVPFQVAYMTLIDEIRMNSPQAQIFLTLGPFTVDPDRATFYSLLDDIIAASGDPNIHRLNIDAQDPSLGVGCDWHPTWVEDARMATQLAAQMQPILGIPVRSSDPNPYKP